jgi:hypothetical protein
MTVYTRALICWCECVQSELESRIHQPGLDSSTRWIGIWIHHPTFYRWIGIWTHQPGGLESGFVNQVDWNLDSSTHVLQVDWNLDLSTRDLDLCGLGSGFIIGIWIHQPMLQVD